MLRRGRGRSDGTRASAAAHGRLAGGCYSLRRRWLPQKRSAQLGQRMGPTSSLWFFRLCSTSYEEDWCGREDSNFHVLSDTTTSTLRVYQFRHGRTCKMPSDRAAGWQASAPSKAICATQPEFIHQRHSARSPRPIQLPVALLEKLSFMFLELAGTSSLPL